MSFPGPRCLGERGKEGLLRWIREESQQKTTGRGTRGAGAESGGPRVPRAGPAVPAPRAASVSAPGPVGSRRAGPGRGAGASPAGLSAAIFPPRLELFPAGGVAPTPAAAGLAAGSARPGTTLRSARARPPLVRARTDHGLRK